MTWIVEVTATYPEEITPEEQGHLSAIFPEGARWDEHVLSYEHEYGNRSKYAAIRPTIDSLQRIFDPVADDAYYHPWPVTVVARCYWR